MDKQSWSSRPWAVGLAAILAGAGAILSGSPLERSLFQWLHPLGAAAPTLWAYLSTLGLGLVMVLLLSLPGPGRAELLVRGILALVCGGLLVQALKYGLNVPRPLVALGDAEVQMIGIPLGGRSLPSGHSAAAGALLLLVLHECRGAAPSRLAAGVAWSMLALAMLICLSRIAVGAHWPGDVLVGLAIGLVVAWVILELPSMQWLVGTWAQGMRSLAGSRITAAWLVCAAAALWVGEREQPLAEPIYALMPLAVLVVAWRWWCLHPTGFARLAGRMLPLSRRLRRSGIQP